LVVSAGLEQDSTAMAARALKMHYSLLIGAHSFGGRAKPKLKLGTFRWRWRCAEFLLVSELVSALRRFEGYQKITNVKFWLCA
jgi:hypothetical protein